MTYCAAIRLEQGMIFASDTRTNAGVDHISTFRKLYQYGIEGERFIVIQSAGNLATSQAVFTKLQNAINADQAPNLHTVSTLFDAAQLVGEYLRKIVLQSETLAADNGKSKFTSSFMLGGQIKGQPAELYMIYPEGNCIRATKDTPFFQLGESKYGKPILDRSMSYQSDLNQALNAILISFDSTIRSNLTVGLPIDLVVYQNDSLHLPEGRRIDEYDPFFADIRQKWSEGLRSTLNGFPPSPSEYWR